MYQENILVENIVIKFENWFFCYVFSYVSLFLGLVGEDLKELKDIM